MNFLFKISCAQRCQSWQRHSKQFGRKTKKGCFFLDFFLTKCFLKKKVRFNAPRIPVVFNVDAEAETDANAIKKKLLDQLVKPVLWDRSMSNAIRNYNLAHVVEVGPGNVLTGIMRRILKASNAPVKPRPSSTSV